jgi:hypothetical protein
MKKMRFIGLASLALALWVFRADVFAGPCNEEFPPFANCSYPGAGNVTCENYGGEIEQECYSTCDTYYGGVYQFDCIDGEMNDYIYCLCWAA